MNDRCDAHSIWYSLRYIFLFLQLTLLTGCIQPNQAITQSSSTFKESTVAPGITMWTNVTKKIYVIEADMSKTELRSISGAHTSTEKVGQMKFDEFWAKNNNNNGVLHVLINGTFFQTYNQPTGIAFGLKQDNQLITYGYGLNEFPDKTMTVDWSEGRIWIGPYSRSIFDTTPNVVGALAPTAGKNADKRLPRTFIGVKDQKKGRSYRTVLIFISPAATQPEAEQTLLKFGAERVAMLDGGASTGLIVSGKSIMQPKTRIPQTIGIFTK